ncbi:MAG: hypothetical protein NVS1B11_31540 [Terriglobales bacterium]
MTDEKISPPSPSQQSADKEPITLAALSPPGELPLKHSELSVSATKTLLDTDQFQQRNAPSSSKVVYESGPVEPHKPTVQQAGKKENAA